VKTTRREFAAFGLGGAGTILVVGAGGLIVGSPVIASGPRLPWFQKVKRLGQTNFNERDPELGDVEDRADYWSSAGVQAVVLSVSGPIAFYPTNVKYFHISGRRCSSAASAARSSMTKA